MFTYKKIYDISFLKKKVLLSVDYNIPIEPLNPSSKFPYRLVETVPTIKYLLEQGASIILLSHLGRPKGKFQEKFSLRPIAKMLSNLLNYPVHFLDNCIGESIENFISKMKPMQIVLLENLRFHSQELDNDIQFSKKLSSYGDYHINESFGTLHRTQASTVGIANFIPSICGFLMNKEIEFFKKFMNESIEKKIIMIGGSKISSKLEFLNKLMNKAKTLILGGGMAYTLLKSLGYSIGSSLIEMNHLSLAKEFLEEAKFQGTKIYLPIDHVAIEKSSNAIKNFDHNISDNYIGMDIGEKTIEYFKHLIKESNSIFWNGPLGIFENPLFSNGTYSIANFLAMEKMFRIVGGGNSVSAIQSLNLESSFDHISTGGGSALYLIANNGDLESLRSLERDVELL